MIVKPDMNVITPKSNETKEESSLQSTHNLNAVGINLDENS
jgi:hypothetical protein